MARLLAGIKAVVPEPLASDSPDAVMRLFASTKTCVSCSSKSDTADTRRRHGRQQPEQHKKKDYESSKYKPCLIYETLTKTINNGTNTLDIFINRYPSNLLAINPTKA